MRSTQFCIVILSSEFAHLEIDEGSEGEMRIVPCAVLVLCSLFRLTNSSWTVNNAQNDVLNVPIEMAAVR